MKLKMSYDDFSKSRVQLVCLDESMAQQHFREECDINTIVRRFGLTGEMPSNYRAPVYGDFEGINDFQSALNAVRSAGEAFMEMPAALRAKFLNDPQKLVEFVGNEENRDEAIKLGLVPPPPPAPAPVSSASSPVAAVTASPGSQPGGGSDVGGNKAGVPAST